MHNVYYAMYAFFSPFYAALVIFLMAILLFVRLIIFAVEGQLSWQQAGIGLLLMGILSLIGWVLLKISGSEDDTKNGAEES